MSQLTVTSSAKALEKTIEWRNVGVGQVVRRQGVDKAHYMKLTTGGGLFLNSAGPNAAQGQVIPTTRLSYSTYVLVSKASLSIED